MLRHVHAAAPRKYFIALGLALLMVAGNVSATTFIVPTDEDMIAKSERIVIGTVQSSYVRGSDGSIDTVYDFRIERSIKGKATSTDGSSLEIVSPGGVLENRALVVHSAAHFAMGEKVLLFLVKNHGEWTPVDLTLGKFRFVTSGKGDRLLTRDLQDVAAWERDGTHHEEKVRREEQFLRFIQERVAGRRVKAEDLDYLVDPASVVLPPAPESGPMRVRSNDTYTPGSYTSFLTCPPPFCDPQIGPFPSRWPTFPGAVTFHKKDNTDIAGAGDGGVGTIQSGLAAWTNDCGSNVNIVYGGTTSTASANFDSVHVVEFNDPQGRISGSFGPGGGTVAVAFTSYGNTHNALSTTWWSITDADVVFQDGFTAANAAFNTAMTHEFGHCIGWRHSNANPSSGNDQTITCNAANEDCTPTGTAIMFWQAISGFGFTLQPWDINAVRAVYPSSCVTLTAPTNVLATATGGTSVNVSWTNAPGATSYNVYRSTNNSTFTKISSDGAVLSTPFVDGTAVANTAYAYRVRSVQSAVESTDSNKDFTVTVVYTDPNITAQSTTIKAAHITQLRTAVNALRTLNAGQVAFSFTDAALNSTIAAKVVHITQLRTELSSVRVALGFSAFTPATDPTVNTSTLIKKAHIDELRAGAL